MLGLTMSFHRKRQLWVVLDWKSSQECPIKVRVLQGSIIQSFSYYTLIIYSMLSAILLSILMILLSTLSISGLDLWQEFELTSDIDSDLQDIDCRNRLRKWLVDFNPRKTLFWLLKNPGTINVKIDESVPDKKWSFKMLGLSFSSKVNWALSLPLLLKLTLFYLRSLFLLRLSFISIILSYSIAQNTSGLVLVISTV